MQVGRATDLDVLKGHVWNEDEEADGDKIPGLGRSVHGHREQVLGTAVYIIPSDRVFGAHQMRTDTDGHSGYWDADSGSLKNQARVVVGKYDEVTE